MSWKAFFNYTKAEKRGIIVLVIAIFIVLAIKLFFIPEMEEWRMEEATRRELDMYRFQLQQEQKKKTILDDHKKSNFSKSVKLKVNSPFDPNTIDKKQWMQMGFSDKQAQTIINYREKGGRFYTKEDLQKMYSISDDAYQQLEPFIDISIPKAEERESLTTAVKIPEEKLIVALNRADENELQLINGIGPSYSKRIVKYRSLLGGYVHADQLYEVYGFDSSIVACMLPYIVIEKEELIQININTASTKDLYKHPYISKRLAYTITQHREQEGKYKSLEKLKSLSGVTAEVYRKIAPYLSIE